MHEQNGRASWGAPSPLDIILHEVRAGRDEQMRTREELGGLKSDMRQSLSNDREIFVQIREARDRLTTLEAGKASRSTRPPTAAAGSLTSLTKFLVAAKEVLPPLREVLAALLLLAVALGLVAPLHLPSPPAAATAPQTPSAP